MANDIANTIKQKINLKNKPRKGLSIIIMLVVVCKVLLFGLVGFITDWFWFQDLGYTDVFWKQLVTELEIGIPVFIVVTLAMRFYLRTIKNGYFRKIKSHEIPNGRRLNIISWLLAVLFGIFVAFVSAKSIWINFLQAKYASSFNLEDPLFKQDISFYIFKLDFLDELNNIIIGVIIGMVILTLVYYAYLLTVRTPDIFKKDEEEPPKQSKKEFNIFEGTPFEKLFSNKSWNSNGAGLGKMVTDAASKSNINNLLSIASGKLTILGVIFYVMLGFDFYLKQFDLLHAHTGAVYGAGFSDVNIILWIYRIIMGLSVIGAITLAIHIFQKHPLRLVRVPALMIIVYMAGMGVNLIVQNLVVSPDEINKESKYLKNNIEYTRHAYSIDDVKVSEYAADQSLNSNVIANNSPTISNIRINDYEPVEDFYNQTQSIRQYYHFNDVDIDRYNMSAGETQTYLSAREIDDSKISNTWLNKHLKYTHGYGAAVSQVNTVTASGQPDIVVGNIPPESESDTLRITRPEIYFGELTDDYVIVNTKEQEFDYPDGSANKYSNYEGNTGIKLTFLKRILYAIREGSIKILVSSNITSDSKIMYTRNVVERVKKIMPYLSYENDPYMVVDQGHLYWILDAYTTSNNYPYSEPYEDRVNTTNYIRNSVKVVVNAYDGSVNFYVCDAEDPIAITFQKIYPTLFKSFDKMPVGIKSHIRYPNALFKIQASVYTKYHMEDVKVFYQKEDLWDIAHQIYGMEETEMDPSYYIFNLPDTEESAEFINMIPFTPKSKQNMTAIMMARNDGGHYGEMIVYTFPKNKTVYGPMQIEAQIDQNTEISKEFSLWNSSGSKYKRGDLFVIPIGTSLMYVEPVYLEASNQAIPEVKRVIVAYGDRIAYEATLGDALSSLFGGEYETQNQGSTSQESGGGSLRNLAKLAQEAYQNAVAAQKEGNWSEYEKYIKLLENYLNKMV